MANLTIYNNLAYFELTDNKLYENWKVGKDEDGEKKHALKRLAGGVESEVNANSAPNWVVVEAGTGFGKSISSSR